MGISSTQDNQLSWRPPVMAQTIAAPPSVPERRRFLAMAEVAANSEGQLPEELLRGLYRLSALGTIVLALRDTSWAAIDLVLDELVHQLPLTIPGVRYVDAEDASALAEAARHSPAVIAATPGFLIRLDHLGIRPLAIFRTGRGWSPSDGRAVAQKAVNGCD